MVFDRPRRTGQGNSPAPTQRLNAPMQRPNRQGGERPGQPQRRDGGDRGRGHGGGGNGGNDVPSPWLIPPEFDPDPTASFVEYLRWMRSPDSQHKDPTKVQILQMAEENANYRDRLTELTKRTELIAGKENTFQVKCLWRIRVGGHRGPESILLPAFDALGMPYIPASTLRGVARTQAIRDVMAQRNLAWKQAEEIISREYFGFLDSKDPSERAGKIIFLDAYPLPLPSGKGGGLAVDMANNIWSWDSAGRDLLYKPNPNPFLSLQESTFLIGIRPVSSHSTALVDQVKQWLSQGLQAGIGSQVNTGYGSLVRAGKPRAAEEFFSVEFTLQGQLIHGRQKFTQWNWNDRRNEWQMRGNPDAEVRPVAFKSMLRYWFRALGLGVLSSREVQRLEAMLFGAISPNQTRGWLTVRIADGRVVQREARPNRDGQRDPCGEQSGRLILAFSSEIPDEQKSAVQELLKALTWLMFHLGGLGQGARRPCYSRKNRERAPWWRGSTLIPDSKDPFWELPDDIHEFKALFQKRLRQFYETLEQVTGARVNYQHPNAVGTVTREHWTEAVDANCLILVCSGQEDFNKPYALATLHSQDLKVPNRRGEADYDGNLCGQVQGGVKPSPVWIADLGDYQVMTVFGAAQDPRKRYISQLRSGTSRLNYAQIFPWS